MVDINQVYVSSGDRLKAVDFQNADGSFPFIKAVIEKAEEHDVSRAEEPEAKKIVLSFVDKDKDIVLNKTNSFNIASRYGAETDKWIGKTVNITGSLKAIGNDMKPGFDITAPAPTEAEMEAEYAASAAPAGDSIEGDVPF